MAFSVCYSWQSVVLGAAVDEVAFGEVAFGELAFSESGILFILFVGVEQSTFLVLQLLAWSFKDTSPATAGDLAVRAVADCRSGRRWMVSVAESDEDLAWQQQPTDARHQQQQQFAPHSAPSARTPTYTGRSQQKRLEAAQQQRQQQQQQLRLPSNGFGGGRTYDGRHDALAIGRPAAPLFFIKQHIPRESQY